MTEKPSCNSDRHARIIAQLKSDADRATFERLSAEILRLHFEVESAKFMSQLGYNPGLYRMARACDCPQDIVDWLCARVGSLSFDQNEELHKLLAKLGGAYLIARRADDECRPSRSASSAFQLQREIPALIRLILGLPAPTLKK